MTEKMERFCVAYAKEKNATAAAIKAGYKPKNAGYNADKLLKNIKIQDRLAELAEEAREEKESEYHGHILNIAEMQGKLSEIINRQLEDYKLAVIDGVPTPTAVPAELKDIIKAIDQLTRMQGGYRDHIAVEGAVPIVLSGEDGLKE